MDRPDKADVDTMFIGKLARATGLSVQAIRYYEVEGLLLPPRTLTRYRLYTHEHVRRLQFIVRLQALGFTIREVGQVLTVLDSDSTGCGSLAQMAYAKLVELESRLELLRRLHGTFCEFTARGESLKYLDLLDQVLSEPS